MPNLVLIFLALGFGLLHALIGGARLVYALPAYAFVAVAGIIAFWAPGGRERRNTRTVCVVSTVALVAYVCVRGMTSPVAYLARPDLFIALAAVVVYVLASVHLTSPTERMIFFCTLAAFAFFHVVVGAVQFRQGDDSMLLPWIFRPEQYYWRASGFFICPSHLAAGLEILALMGLGICCWARSSAATRMLSAYGALICFVGIAITGSRESYLSTIAGVGVLAVVCLWIVRAFFPEKFTSLLIFAIASVALLLGASVNIMGKSEQLTRGIDEGVQKNIRPVLMQAALQQHRVSPALGTGSGTTLFFERQFRQPQMQGDPVHANSDYTEFFAEYGYVGAGIAAIFVFSHLGSGFVSIGRMVREKRRSTRDRQSSELSLAVGAIAAATVMLVHSLTDVSLHIPANALLAAFVFGVLANPGTHFSRRFRGELAAPPWWTRTVAPALGIVLLATSLPLVKGEYYGELARVALRDRQFDEAAANAKIALTFSQKNADLYYTAGEAEHYLGLGENDAETRFLHYSAAADDFAHGLALFPQDTRLLLKMGRTLDNLGRSAGAATYFERAVQADPNLGNVHARYGVHWQMYGALVKAREAYLKAAALGETQISTSGLRDLEQLRERPLKRRLVQDALSDFLSEPETQLLPEEVKPKPAGEEPGKSATIGG